jgi:hypothetical protein
MNEDSEQRTSFWSAKQNAHSGHWKFGIIATRERERDLFQSFI